MPKTTYTDTPLAPNVKDVLKTGVSYDWTILSAEERIIPASGNELMEFFCKESNTEATSRMTLFFTPNTAPQVTRFLRSCGIERSPGAEVDVNEELVKGRSFSAKLKEGKPFNNKDGEPVTPWEIDGFSCGKPVSLKEPATVATTSKSPSPATEEKGW